MASAWKVGVFVIIFAGLMLGVYAVLQKSLFAVEQDSYVVVFDDAGGLTTGSAVLYAGVKIGEVGAVELTEDSKAKVILSIDADRKIPLGTTAVLPGSFISIGDRQLLLKPPASVDGYYASGKAQSNPIPG